MKDITPLQSVILDTIGPVAISGRDLRALLKKRNVKLSAPAFYLAMTRLEDAGLVKSCYTQERILGQTVKSKWFELSDAGDIVIASRAEIVWLKTLTNAF